MAAFDLTVFPKLATGCLYFTSPPNLKAGQPGMLLFNPARSVSLAGRCPVPPPPPPRQAPRKLAAVAGSSPKSSQASKPAPPVWLRQPKVNVGYNNWEVRVKFAVDVGLFKEPHRVCTLGVDVDVVLFTWGTSHKNQTLEEACMASVCISFIKAVLVVPG